MYHLQRLDVDTLALPADMEPLPHHHQQRILAYRNPADQRRSLGGALLLDNWLKALNLTLDDIATHPQGKPYLPNQPHHFNLSHAGHYAVLATAQVPIGVDIAVLDPHYLKLSDRVLSPEEQAQFPIYDDDLSTFYRFWTLKESFIKATGRGLATPLRQVAFQLGQPSTLLDPQLSHRYLFDEPTPPHGYHIAVCLKKP